MGVGVDVSVSVSVSAMVVMIVRITLLVSAKTGVSAGMVVRIVRGERGSR
jgi:hypothetical protein